MSQDDSSHLRASDQPHDYATTTIGGTGHRKSRRPSQGNTETRYIHIQDPSQYNQGKPIDEAVNTAFSNAHVKDAAGISPELIAQITQSVIQQLKTTSVAETAHTPTTAIPVIHQPQQYSPASPSARSGGSPPPRIFTPPSPQKHSETHDTQAERLSDASSSPTGRFRSASNVSMADDGIERPRHPPRQPTIEEATTLEKIWGKLFDEEGKATPRLGQFLRGLATHLIEDTEPKQSIVVTPTKMIDFYEATKISHDMLPWNDIFDDAHSSISRMYRQLNIQHHLVQDDDKFHLKPDIPGLTAKGFEKWQTLMILAYPEREYERLQIAALHMPINNPDDKKERFPKDIPRRLFPKIERSDIRHQLIDAMETHAEINLPRNDDTPTPRNEHPPPQQQQQHQYRRDSDTASHESFTDDSVTSEGPYPRRGIERERKPYSRIPPGSAIDDLNPTISTPIERERKPYVAAPGGGKFHDDQDGPPPSYTGPYNPVPPPPPPTNGNPAGLQRSASNASRPINIPPPPMKGPSGHRMSTSEYASPLVNLHQAPHLRDPAGSRRRNQSPLGNDMRRSDTDIRRFQSSSYESPSYMPQQEAYPPPPPHAQPGQFVHGDPRYEDDRRYGREGDLRRENYARGGSPNRRGVVTDDDYYRRRDQPPRNW